MFSNTRKSSSSHVRNGTIFLICGCVGANDITLVTVGEGTFLVIVYLLCSRELGKFPKIFFFLDSDFISVVK